MSVSHTRVKSLTPTFLMCEGPVYLSLLICVGGGALELLPELFPLLSDPTEESRASSEVGGARVDPGEGDSSFCKNTELNREIGKFILNSPTAQPACVNVVLPGRKLLRRQRRRWPRRRGRRQPLRPRRRQSFGSSRRPSWSASRFAAGIPRVKRSASSEHR